MPPITFCTRRNPRDCGMLTAIELRYPLPQITAKPSSLRSPPIAPGRRGRGWGTAASSWTTSPRAGGRACGSPGAPQLALRKLRQLRQCAERWGSDEIDLHVMGKIGWPVRQVLDHSVDELLPVFDLRCPVEHSLLANRGERSGGNLAPAQRSGAMRR